MRRIALLLNPIAGMGGRVGLKGTDGCLDEAARARGATPRAPERARETLAELRAHLDDADLLYTYGDPMGAAEARAVGFDPVVVGTPETDRTTAADTRRAVAAFVSEGIDCLVFVGGDGTAVDITAALADLDASTPILGVPAGVKVYSAIFAVSPAAAGRIASTHERTETREVSDLDEAAYREGTVRSRVRGVVSVPVAECGALQSAKRLAGGTVETLAAGFAGEIDPERTYVFGPGGTIGAIETALGIDGSALGVDVWRDGDLLVRDAGETAILAALGDRNTVVVSPIGGQGFVLGRGNDQLSPAVLRRCELAIVASRTKLDGLGVLRVDTGDAALDRELRGWHRVRVGRFENRLVELV
jgi:predicted polyphosphate/ATP-dependent NAD kinase